MVTLTSHNQVIGSGGRPATDDALECSQEPIHIPGTIQPHGALLTIDPARDLMVVAASHNAGKLLGVSPATAALATGKVVGRDIASILGQAFTETLLERLRDGRLHGDKPWQSTLRSDRHHPAFELTVHSHAGLIQVEVERAGTDDVADAQATLRHLQDAIAAMRESGDDLEQLALATVRGFRSLTGYERVLIYRFDTDWNGQAIAEDKAPDWDHSLAGLRFPASDIPVQARELYRRSLVRWVADRDAAPIPIDVDAGWMGDQPPPRAIDLSFVRLRSLSPIHLQIHRNLGIDGSMSLSILHRERLWGLIVCHHRRPHHLSSSQRSATYALADAFALRLGPTERSDLDQARRDDLVRLSALLAHMAVADVVSTALTTGHVTIGSLFTSTGAVVIHDGIVSLLDETPPEADVRRLAAWLRTQDGSPDLFQTSNLSRVYPPWARHAAVASGVLAVFLSADRSDMLLWFRPEEAQLASFGGSSRDGVANNASSLPRHSFERWVEERHGSARPWAEWELEMADSLRHGITEVMLRGLRRLADLHERLRQSQKMEAVGQLTGGIAHDFNNLLAGILGSLELLRSRMSQGRFGEMERYIGMAVTSANRAASLTHRLLAFSRRQTLDPKTIDVNRLTASMEDLIRRTVGPAIHVATAISDDLWRTLCDANQLESALLNLAINARDAMPDGGRLTIQATNARLDAAYADRHPEVAPGEYVAVSVTDTGTGMTPEVIARVFEPFFTTKPFGQGTGLGLSMVYGFAKQSNGYTQIDSDPGRGTTVCLYLPRDLKTGEAEAGEPVSHPVSTAGAGETVLVVDDEPVVRMLISDMLRDLGYGVVEAADGAEGLRVVQSRQDIDLLVSDVGLPGGMNGRQLADAARLHQPRLKVLFITGYAENALFGKGVLEADMQLITKPFALDMLAAKIQAML